jgi:hypothetical protein
MTGGENLGPPPDLDYTIDIAHPTVHANGDIDYGGMTFLRDNNPNGIAPELRQEGDADFLRLAVAKNAFTAAKEGEPDMRDRCELRDGKIRLGTSVWYSFEMRLEEGFPEVDARFICAQIKAPYYDDNGGSPLIALRIERGRYFATIEHLYETKDADFVDGSERSHYLTAYAGPGSCGRSVRALDHHVFGNSLLDFKELQVRAVLATDPRGMPGYLDSEFQSCTSGVQLERSGDLPDDVHRWWRFKIGVAPTKRKDYAGIVQLFVADPGANADRLVATAKGEFGHTGYEDPAINTGPPDGQSYQYFKIGPYRDKLHLWGAPAAALHVRNIRRGAWDFGEQFQREGLVI